MALSLFRDVFMFFSASKTMIMLRFLARAYRNSSEAKFFSFLRASVATLITSTTSSTAASEKFMRSFIFATCGCKTSRVFS